MIERILPQIQQIHLGPITLYTYGLIIGIAICVAILVFYKVANPAITKSLNFEVYFVITLISGLFFGRLFYVIAHLSSFIDNPISFFEVWNGGTTILGVITGLLISSILFWRLKFQKKMPKYNVSEITDPLCVSLAIGQVIGRWANFINQELFGKPTNLPWKIYIPIENRPLQYSNYSYFHPTFLYEALLDLINFTILLSILKKTQENRQKVPAGITTSLYLVFYGIIRMILERFRSDAEPVVGIFKTANIISFIFIVIGLILALKLWHLKSQKQPKDKLRK